MALPDPWRMAGDERTFESGQAWVYEVGRPGDERVYALKRLKNERRLDRFVREVATMRELREQGLEALPIVVEAVLAGPRPYFVMPWYSCSLQDEIDAEAYVDDPQAAVAVLRKIAQALGALHARAVAHRDLKPANILFDGDEPLLADFGLCLQVEDDGERLTGHDEAVGSRLYVAPENESGINEDVDQRPADLYAFGKLIWAVLAGRNPPAREQQREPENQLQRLVGDQRFALLDALQEQLLRTDPRARLADWDAVDRELELLAAALEGRPPTHLPPPEEQLRRQAQRVRGLAQVRQAIEDRASLDEENDWLNDLVQLMHRRAEEAFGDRLQELMDETDGAITLAIENTTQKLSEVGASLNGLEFLGIVGLEPDATAGPRIGFGTAAQVGFVAHASNRIEGVLPLYVPIYITFQETGLYFIRLPFIADSSARLVAVTPPGLTIRYAATSGPHPFLLTQTLVAGEAFAAESAAVFLEMLERYYAVVAEGGDLAAEASWA